MRAASSLAPGDTFTSLDAGVTVVSPQEPWPDPFGRSMFRFWCRSDDGREGWMCFGPTGQVEVS